MFEILVTSINKVVFVREAFQATKIIGLLDPEKIPPMPVDNIYHVEYFYDVKNIREADTLMTLTEGTQSVCPSKEQIERILNWSKTFTDDDRVIVHCHAGMSRSPAVAIAILVQAGMTPKDAFSKINTLKKGNISPNSLIISLADEIIGSDGALVAAMDEWREENKKKPHVQGMMDTLMKIKSFE